MCTMDDDRAPPISSLSQLYPKPMLVVKTPLEKIVMETRFLVFNRRKKGGAE